MTTASSLDRVMQCAASAALPQANVASAAADAGTATHDFVEAARRRAEELAGAGQPYEEALARARDEVLAAIAEEADHYPLCSAIDLSLIPRGAESEVAVAWDPATDQGRILGKGLGRDYTGARAGEIPGTADLLGELPGRRVFVPDFKTGKKVAGGAAGTWQLRLLALAAARAVGARGAHVLLVYPRADGRVYVDRADFDVFDLVGFRDALRGMLDRVARAREEVAAGRVPNVSEGPWCRYCPALPSCPAKVQLVRNLVARPTEASTEEVVRAQIMALAPAKVGEAYAKLELAEQYLKRVREAIETYARQAGAVPLPDGRELREVVSTRRYLDPKVALDVLLLLDEQEPEERRIALDAVSMEPVTSAAAIRRALTKHKRKAKEAEAVVEEIGRRNGFIVKTSVPVKAVKAGELEIPEAQDDTQERAPRRAQGG